MKKIVFGLAVAAGLGLNSCEPWEDESYHPGGNNGNGMLLKEVKTVSAGVEGLATYTYDAENRFKEGFSYANILDMETYSHITQSYSGDSNTHTVAKTYMSGTLFTTSTIDTELNGNLITMNMEMEFGGETITSVSEITFSQPCGVQQNHTTTNMPEFPDPIESVSTYQYTDSNCSFKEFVDGELSSTVTMDDKFSPFTTPESIAMGVVQHNAVKIENADGTIETITYTYNEQNYPIQAVHTFNEGSGQADYTETFVYY